MTLLPDVGLRLDDDPPSPLCRELGIEYPGMIPPDFDGDPDDAPMWAGESASSVNDIKPAAEIVRDLVRETEAALSRS